MFSSAVAIASKEINQSVVQPGLTKAQAYAGDTNSEEVKKYLSGAAQQAKVAASWAGQRAGEGWEGVNHLAKEKGGVDLNEGLGRLGLGARPGGGYGQLERAEDGVISPHARGDDDFFDEWDDHPVGATSGAIGSAGKVQTGQAAKKGNDWDKDDEWKEF